MNILEELVGFIKANLSLDIRNDLSGNGHICLLFGTPEVLSSINIDSIWMDTQNSNG